MWISILLTCMSVTHMCLWSSEGGAGSPETGIIDKLWANHVGAGSWTQVICNGNKCGAISSVPPCWRELPALSAVSLRVSCYVLACFNRSSVWGQTYVCPSLSPSKKDTSLRKRKFCFRELIYLFIIIKHWYRIFWLVPTVHKHDQVCLTIWQTVLQIHGWNVPCR